MTFRPAKGRFARTKTANHKSSSASEPPHRARRSALSFKDRKLFIPVPVNNVSSDICRQDAFCALYTDGISCRKQFRYRSQQNTPLGRTFPFLTKWFPPLSRGWHCPQGVLLARRRVRRHYFATRKTPLNTRRVLQCSGKGAT